MMLLVLAVLVSVAFVESFVSPRAINPQSRNHVAPQTCIQQESGAPFPSRQRRRDNGSFLRVSSSSEEESTQSWLDKGLLLSSFTDGLKSNRDAQDWLCDALVERLWKNFQQQSERALHESNTFSPCNGPDPVVWQQLEDIDQQVEQLYPKHSKKDDGPTNWRQSLDMLLAAAQQPPSSPPELRVLYIPTALYALRQDSANTPGKQRQRARADGKKRRNEIVAMLQDNLKGVAISAVTLDFDDGSVKQAECTMQENDEFTSQFPKVRESSKRRALAAPFLSSMNLTMFLVCLFMIDRQTINQEMETPFDLCTGR
jgi:hypothetical protein